jgi:hypothetical protein
MLDGINAAAEEQKPGEPCGAPQDNPNPQPAPSTPTQPGAEPQQHPNDPIKIDPDMPFKNPSQAEEDAQKQQQSSGAMGAGALPYQPNYKYKAYSQEYEMPEWARPLLTPETEDKLRDLFSRGHGMETFKEVLKKRDEELTGVKTQHEALRTDLQALSKFIQNDDFSSFFESLSIPKQKILQWSLQQARLEQLPPEERAVYDREEHERKRSYLLERQNQQLRQQYEQEVDRIRSQELEQVLSTQEVLPVAQQFDSRMGRAGAFREEVIKRGLLHYQMNGIDIPPRQAVQEVLSVLGHSMGQGTPAPQNAPVNNQQATQFQPNPAQNRPPVIPNVSSRNTSPTRKVPGSLEDLKQIYSQMAS